MEELNRIQNHFINRGKDYNKLLIIEVINFEKIKCNWFRDDNMKPVEIFLTMIELIHTLKQYPGENFELLNILTNYYPEYII